MLFYQKILDLMVRYCPDCYKGGKTMGMIKKMSVFPNGEKIYNDKLIHNLQIVYNLMESYDGRSILYLLLFKVVWGKNSPGALSSGMKDFKTSMNELGLTDSRGRIPKDLRNTLIYLEEENKLIDRLHKSMILGARVTFKVTLTLDQYDPTTGRVFKAKDSYKAYRDEDFRLSEATKEFLKSLGRD